MPKDSSVTPRGQAQAEERLQRRLGYDFADLTLLRQALTHKSFGSDHNERLEFLGDAVLGYAVAAALFERFPEVSEAALTMMRAQLVRKETLASVARSIHLGDALLLGAGERNTGGHERASVLADGLEAVLGAVFLDARATAHGPDSAVLGVIERLCADGMAQLNPLMIKDNKTRLQEYLQGQGLALPEYRIEDLSGAPHEQQFTVCCLVAALAQQAQGRGTSRRAAEQQAAGKLLAQLDELEMQGS